jgi:Flp pilus assembly protein TadG
VAAVELALLLPVVVALLLGLWEVGRLIEVQQLLTNAAREGARQATTGSFTNSEIQAVVTNTLAAEGLPTANVQVTVQDLTNNVDVSNATYLDTLQVTVTIPCQDIQWSLLSLIVNPGDVLSINVTWTTMVDKSFQGFTEPPAG